MRLYEVKPHDDHLVHVVARNSHEAADLYLTCSLAQGGDPKSFSVAVIPIDSLDAEQKTQVQAAFDAGLVGVCHYCEEIGWTFAPPLWQPLGADEMPPLPGEEVQ